MFLPFETTLEMYLEELVALGSDRAQDTLSIIRNIPDGYELVLIYNAHTPITRPDHVKPVWQMEQFNYKTSGNGEAWHHWDWFILKRAYVKDKRGSEIFLTTEEKPVVQQYELGSPSSFSYSSLENAAI